MHHQRVLLRHDLLAHDQRAPRRQAPPAGAERPVQDPPVLDLGQVQNTIGLDLNVVRDQRLHKHLGRLGGEGRRRQALEGGRPVNRLLLGFGAVAVAVAVRAGGGEGRGEGGGARRAGVVGGWDLGGEGWVDFVDGRGLQDGGLRVDVAVYGAAGGFEVVW